MAHTADPSAFGKEQQEKHMPCPLEEMPSYHRERALMKMMADEIHEVTEDAEKHVLLRQEISKLEDRVANLKQWDPHDDDGCKMQAEALRIEIEVIDLKKKAEQKMTDILEKIVEIEINFEVVADLQGIAMVNQQQKYGVESDECRRGQRVVLSRRFAAMERYKEYAGWVGVLDSRVRQGVWAVKFPGMLLTPTLELPVATGEGPHIEGSYALIYAISRFRRCANDTDAKARKMMTTCEELKAEANKQQAGTPQHQAAMALWEESCRGIYVCMYFNVFHKINTHI
jgi:hypothetical protein